MASVSRDLRFVVALGALQGLTEFLPISSSGHLVVAKGLVGGIGPSLLFDILLHVGTLAPIVWLYRGEIAQLIAALPRLPAIRRRWRSDRALRILGAIALASVPTALIGLLLHDLFERLFSSPLFVGFSFLVTGAILLATLLPAARRPRAATDPVWTLTAGRVLAIGCAQSLAITPGISRSGTTIAAALLLGVERELAAELSFLISIPAILGALMLQLSEVALTAEPVASYLVGALVAAISGYLALRWVVRLVRRGSLHWFAIYLWPLGIAVVARNLLRS